MRRVTYLSRALFFIVLFGGVAHADNIDRLIRKLNTGNQNVRLSATLNLSKTKNARAIQPLINALRDRNKTVRGAAAAGLGKLASTKRASRYKSTVVKALTSMSKSDKHQFVRKQAKKSLAVWGQGGRGSARGAASGRSVKRGGVYVHIEALHDATDNNADIAMKTKRVMSKAMSKGAPEYGTAWPTGRTPGKKDIKKMGVQAYMVGGTINTLDVGGQGRQVDVSCKVSLYVATFPRKSMFGFLSGGAQVSTSNGTDAVEEAKSTCVEAVLGSLVKGKVIRAIQAKAR